MRRLVLAATEALAGFSSAAAAALASSGAASPAQPAPPMGLTAQMLAATSSLTSCISLVGINPSLPAQTAVRIGAACSLVFGPGCSLLGWLLKAAEAAPSTAVRSQIDSLCASQLESVASTALVLGCNSTPQAAAAFAAGTAKPAALLPWLATVMCAIPADDPGCGSPEGEAMGTPGQGLPCSGHAPAMQQIRFRQGQVLEGGHALQHVVALTLCVACTAHRRRPAQHQPGVCPDDARDAD